MHPREGAHPGRRRDDLSGAMAPGGLRARHPWAIVEEPLPVLPALQRCTRATPRRRHLFSIQPRDTVQAAPCLAGLAAQGSRGDERPPGRGQGSHPACAAAPCLHSSQHLALPRGIEMLFHTAQFELPTPAGAASQMAARSRPHVRTGVLIGSLGRERFNLHPYLYPRTMKPATSLLIVLLALASGAHALSPPWCADAVGRDSKWSDRRCI